MSKSLKNFITIDVSNACVSPSLLVVELTAFCQEILGRFTARQLRLAFLTQLWNAKIDFSESLMTGEVKTIEATLNVSFLPRRWHGGADPQSIGSNVKGRISSLSSEP